MSQPSVPWVIVWGYGAEIRATDTILSIRQNGKTQRYPLDTIHHLLIAGGHTIQTAAVGHLLEHDVAITFYDTHGVMKGRVYPTDFSGPSLRSAQKAVPIHKYAMTIVTEAHRSRMRFLHEMAEKREDGLFYKGELEILTDASRELEFLITMPEIARAFLLCKNMYYEILSRTIPEELGYHRREKPPYQDPINALFSYGYAVLSADIALAIDGAGLDPTLGMFYGSVLPIGKGKLACVMDLQEIAVTPMVDRVVIGMAAEGILNDQYEINQRCILGESVLKELNQRLARSINQRIIDEAVASYADAIQRGSPTLLRFE